MPSLIVDVESGGFIVDRDDAGYQRANFQRFALLEAARVVIAFVVEPGFALAVYIQCDGGQTNLPADTVAAGLEKIATGNRAITRQVRRMPIGSDVSAVNFASRSAPSNANASMDIETSIWSDTPTGVRANVRILCRFPDV